MSDELDLFSTPPTPPPPDSSNESDQSNSSEQSDSSNSPSPPPISPPPSDPNAIADGPLKRLIDDNFIRYASYVIRDRAIPEIDDGLKPVQRRILHALHENDDGKFIKVANIVGYTMQFHPHGDASIADALVGLGNKQFLIEGQGNSGNILTGDPAAATRYIECRLTPLAREELFDDDLTESVPSYDGRNQEPVALPSRLPLLLMLGAEGIAVGIATRTLPHNFNELIEAQVAILQKRSYDLVPDFPQGGIMDPSAYDHGRGHVRLRSHVEVRDPQTLVIRETPFGVNTDALIASIEDAARKGKIKLRAIDDFTAGSVEIEIRLQAEADAARAVDALYAFTLCETQVSSRIIAIRDRRPVELTVDEILQHNTARLLRLLQQRLKIQQKRLTEDLHRRTLVQLFVEHRLYRPLESCETAEAMDAAVRDGLAPFTPHLLRDLSKADIEMLLEIPVRRLSRFDLERNRADMEKIRTDLAESRDNLANLIGYAVRYLRTLQRKHGAAFPRRTRIAPFEAVAVRELTASELAIRYDRTKGYLGHSVAGANLLACSSLDKLLLLWLDGRYKVVAPPEKLFVDTTLAQCLVTTREHIITVAYEAEGLTRLKRFPVTAVANREYRSAPKDARVLFCSLDTHDTLYVRYDPAEGGTIRQQEFDIRELPVRERQSNGALMSSKRIAFIGPAKPDDWDDTQTGPKGRFMDR